MAQYKSVVICGSRRFRTEVKKLAQELREAGVIVYEPPLIDMSDNQSVMALPQNLQDRLFDGATYRHIQMIRQADICYILNPGGYIGSSVTFEMGIAKGCNKPIWAQCGIEDLAVKRAIDEIIPIEELLKKL